MDRLAKLICDDLTVVTSAYLEPKEILRRNIRSVQEQDGCRQWQHLVIWDGVTNLECAGQFSDFNKNISLLKVRYNHDDYGDYIRRFGTKLAIYQNSTAVTYMDADNYWSRNHWAVVSRTKANTKKNIIISGRKLIRGNGEETEDFTRDFFDTNTITLFGDAKKIGLLWGLYPRQMSLVGDRIISKYIQEHFADEIAYTEEATVNYRYSRISKEKVMKLKAWYRENYAKVSDNFRKRFGFDLLI